MRRRNLRAPEFPVQRAVLDRLCHVRRCDVGVAAQVRNRSGDFEQVVGGAGGEAELPARGAEKGFDRFRGDLVWFDPIGAKSTQITVRQAGPRQNETAGRL